MKWGECNQVNPAHWLPGPDFIRESIRSKDWASTSLGAIGQWPQSLRTSLGICLQSPNPCCLAWGRGRLQLYNQAYSQLCERPGGAASALGQDFAITWRDAWPSMRSSFECALRAEPALLENQRVPIDRGGAPDEAVMTFCFVPVSDESGGVGGVLVSLLDPEPVALRSQLDRANEELKQLGYTLSHDLRSPLRTLEAMTRMVVTEHSSQLPGDAQALLNQIVRGAKKLADRIDAMSRIAKLAHTPLSRRRVDVASLVSSLVIELRNAAPERHIDVALGELPEIDGDPELLRLVFANILSNAFKFTGKVAQARIEASGQRQGRHVVYYIRDNGAGFDMRYAGKLFGLFQRMHAEAEFEGAGVGLALARCLVARHGGTLRAEARINEGATFSVTLPYELR